MDYEPNRVALRGLAAQCRCDQAVKEGIERLRGDLQVGAAGRRPLPQARRPGEDVIGMPGVQFIDGLEVKQARVQELAALTFYIPIDGRTANVQD